MLQSKQVILSQLWEDFIPTLGGFYPNFGRILSLSLEEKKYTMLNTIFAPKIEGTFCRFRTSYIMPCNCTRPVCLAHQKVLHDLDGLIFRQAKHINRSCECSPTDLPTHLVKAMLEMQLLMVLMPMMWQEHASPSTPSCV